VPVEVHRVRGASRVVDNHTNSAVAAEILHVPFRWIGEVSFVGQEKGGTVVIGAESPPVNSPKEMVGGIDLGVNV